MMLRGHVSALLPRYADGELSPRDARRIERHLGTCARCQRELDDVRLTSRLLRGLPVESAPASVWNAIEAEAWARPGPPSRAPVFRWTFACAALVVVLASVLWWSQATRQRPWQVSAANQAPQRLAVGAWVETGGSSNARITVGTIGTVDVGPDTRVRLGRAGDSEYRLSLARGTISAQIAAPPRLFIVDTPVSTVVDLGCSYTVRVADDGGSELRMTTGWASLEWQGRESLVPAGAMCHTRPGAGPGMPYFEDASAAFRTAADAFSFGSAGPEAVDVMLREARTRDTLTLWHLLSRVQPVVRERVYARLEQLVPPPPGVEREGVLRLDADALRKWREEMAWKW
jgi:hypothetical protein